MKEAIEQYLRSKSYDKFQPKAAFFDMDGVLFDSMPFHAASWVHTFESIGIAFQERDAYLNEGRTGIDTIQQYFERYFGRWATEEEAAGLYRRKCARFNEISTIRRVDGVHELLKRLRADNIDIYVVTGSGQKSLLDTLEHWFPGIFSRDKMVTAYDVTHCKPHPEPYLQALRKAGVAPYEAFVVENAPLGAASAVAAGLFTIAVNTGILSSGELAAQCGGSGIVLDSMADLLSRYGELVGQKK